MVVKVKIASYEYCEGGLRGVSCCKEMDEWNHN